MTPRDAARDWIDRGFFPIPVPHREKKSVLDAWQKLRLTRDDVGAYFSEKYQNVGILLGDDSGTADIDCDCLEAVAAAVELAPPTGMVFGRASKRASHYIYRSTPGISTRQFEDPVDKSMIVELRCQKKDGSIGLQTVVPPSIHESGEPICFEPGRDRQPSNVPATLLADSAARIAAAALLAKYWTGEGSRHKSFLALAGILARTGWQIDVAIAFHRAIYRALWGQAADFGACASEVNSTFEKHAAGDEITGFQTIVELINGIAVARALDWLGITRGSSAGQVVEWPEIAPFVVRQASPLTPQLFPGFLGAMAAAVSGATESPIELAGMLGLAVVAASIARKVVVSPEPGYVEPTNIFTAVGMESGNRKTAVLQRMVEPFIDWEREETERLEPDRKRMVSERKTLEARVERLRRIAAKPGADASLADQIAELEAALPDIAVLPRLWVQDVTPEQLAVVMAEQSERIALLSDEGGIFDLLAGRYSKGVPNLDLFLQAHAGSGYRVDRGSRPPILMRHPALTVAISPQPDVLQNLSNQPGFRGRGLLARFLYGLPPSPLGSRSLMAHPVPTNVRAAYGAGIRRLLTLPLTTTAAAEDKPGHWKLHLSPQAYTSWKDFQRSVEILMREGGKLFELKDWASKLPGAAARIAAVMHCVCVDPRESCAVQVQLMEIALALATALIDQALAVFDLMRRDPAVEDAQRILRWIRRQEKTQFTVRDCFCAHQGHFRKVDSMYPAVHLLEQHGYLRQAPETKSKGRPSEVYLVNPELNKVVA